MCYGGQGLSVYLVFHLSYGLSGRTKKEVQNTEHNLRRTRKGGSLSRQRAESAISPNAKIPERSLPSVLRRQAGVWVDRGLTLPDVEPAAPGAPIFGASFFQNFAFSVDNVGILRYNKIVHALTESPQNFTHNGFCVNIFYAFYKKRGPSDPLCSFVFAHS